MFEYRCVVDRVVDGDTVIVKIDLGFDLVSKQSVRLLGINAPETRTKDLIEKKFGFEAEAYIIDWFKRHPILRVKTYKDDKYGRILGEFFDASELSLETHSLNESLIADGYAWIYDSEDSKNHNYSALSEKRKI